MLVYSGRYVFWVWVGRAPGYFGEGFSIVGHVPWDLLVYAKGWTLHIEGVRPRLRPDTFLGTPLSAPRAWHFISKVSAGGLVRTLSVGPLVCARGLALQMESVRPWRLDTLVCVCVCFHYLCQMVFMNGFVRQLVTIPIVWLSQDWIMQEGFKVDSGSWIMHQRLVH